ncbi:MAG: hypothetical protein ACYDEQ_01435 [Desulfocucumaceae bacterium]
MKEKKRADNILLHCSRCGYPFSPGDAARCPRCLEPVLKCGACDGKCGKCSSGVSGVKKAYSQ